MEEQDGVPEDWMTLIEQKSPAAAEDCALIKRIYTNGEQGVMACISFMPTAKAKREIKQIMAMMQNEMLKIVRQCHLDYDSLREDCANWGDSDEEAEAAMAPTVEEGGAE